MFSMKLFLDAWNSVSEGNVKKSFYNCGIAKDDSNDDEIHCMKHDGPCPNARDLLQKALEENEMHDLSPDVIVDFEQDFENGYASGDSVELTNKIRFIKG